VRILLVREKEQKKSSFSALPQLFNLVISEKSWQNCWHQVEKWKNHLRKCWPQIKPND